MTTVINNPGASNESGSMMGVIVGVVLLLVVGGLFFVYALPAMRDGGGEGLKGTVDVNVNVPTGVAVPAPAVPAAE